MVYSRSMNIFQKLWYHITHFIRNIPANLLKLWRAIIRAFRNFGKNIATKSKNLHRAFVDGDKYVKLSALVLGIGYLKRKQYIKGIIFIALELGFIAFLIFFVPKYLLKIGSLGTVLQEAVYNPITGRNEWNDYDNSLQILLYSVVSIIIIIAYLTIYLKNIVNQRQLQLQTEQGVRLNTFKEDIREYMDKKFATTLLSLPVAGIVVFTIIPLIFMILVAFTNYDVNHLTPANLWSWVGFDNFESLFGQTLSTDFNYAFNMILKWTLEWAFFATITTYIGGIILALVINNPKTKLKKLWRSLFVVTIAVPQFVSLMIVRFFFLDQSIGGYNGIVNNLLIDWGVLDFFHSIGLMQSLTYFPFFSNPEWAKVSIIIINIWVGIPYVMLIVTGILMNIPKDLFESARIDGANRFQVFWKITLPYMLFVTGPYLISSFIGNINNFNVIYLLSVDRTTTDMALSGVRGTETDLLITWLFKLTQDEQNYKMASTVGIVVFLLCSFFTLIAFNYTIRANKEERFQ